MRRTVRKVVTDARASCVGEEPGAGSCGWRRAYAGPRSQRSALEAARRHLDVANHASVVTINIENVYSEWPNRHDIMAWGLAEFEEPRCQQEGRNG